MKTRVFGKGRRIKKSISSEKSVFEVNFLHKTLAKCIITMCLHPESLGKKATGHERIEVSRYSSLLPFLPVSLYRSVSFSLSFNLCPIFSFVLLVVNIVEGVAQNGAAELLNNDNIAV